MPLYWVNISNIKTKTMKLYDFYDLARNMTYDSFAQLICGEMDLTPTDKTEVEINPKEENKEDEDSKDK
ncbi:MAG: hypothetical protein GY679_00880 [Mycoplasma sp.]|nr:hypothetical protein [Mycoplasma sp.]